MSEKILSLCMITKNDEKNLPECLENLKDFCDEIIIVDVGSNDKTVEIAENAGAYVIKEKWDNSLSKAANSCIEHANGKWILLLQANETISKEHQDLILTLLDNPNVEGYQLNICNDSMNYMIFSPVQYLRLFRNRKQYRFINRSFCRLPDEVLTNILNSGTSITQAGFTQLDDIFLISSLLEEDLKGNPYDSYLLYMKGVGLLNRQKFNESIGYLKKAIENANPEYLFTPHIYKCLAWALIYINEYTGALETVEAGIGSFSLYSDLLVLKGEIHKQFKQYGDAIQALERCMKIKEHITNCGEIDISVIFEMLGEAHELTYNYQQAVECYKQAYELGNANQELEEKIEILTAASENNEFILNEEEPLGPLEYVLWSRNFMQILQQFITQYNCNLTALEKKINDTPTEDLISFYKNLSSSNNCIKADDNGLTKKCSEIHTEIGVFFEKGLRKREAFFAYLRALQWDPFYSFAQDRMNCIFTEYPGFVNDISQGEWEIEGSWFVNKASLLEFINAIIEFRNDRFERAIDCFTKIEKKEPLNLLIDAYLISCLLITGRINEAERILNNINKEIPLSQCFRICRDYVLRRLNEGRRMHTYNQFIIAEEERIRSLVQ